MKMFNAVIFLILSVKTDYSEFILKFICETKEEECI